MKLTIHGAEQVDDSFVLEISYDEEFKRCISKQLKTRNVTPREINQYILEVLDRCLDFEDLGK